MKFAMFRTRTGAFSGADALLVAACPDPPNDNTSCPAGELDNCYNRDREFAGRFT
jgi:hypothetical protein